MSFAIYAAVLAISFTASTVGAICGIGGGVVIKPVLDLFGFLSVSAVSFLSGCTVLCMTCYSVIREKISRESLIDMKIGTPLSIGAAIGGIAGRSAFLYILELFDESGIVGTVQSACLLSVTFGTFVYTVNRRKIITRHIKNPAACLITGLALGILSAFLGIGGGPVNLVVLYYFFSMETKTAAQNSLYIILFSQAASLLNTFITGTIPEFPVIILILMITGGISGGILGRAINKRIDEAAVSGLFKILLVIIMMICLINMVRYGMY